MRTIVGALGSSMLAFVVVAGCGGAGETIGSLGGGDDGGNDARASTLTEGVNCLTGPNFTGCPCTMGETKTCYTGALGTRGVAPCRDGVQACTSSAGESLDTVFGACSGETLPTMSATCSPPTDAGMSTPPADATAPVDAPQGVDGPADTSTAPPPDATSPTVAPRPVAPLSVSTVTSQQPTFRWELPAGASGAHVEVCADRGCATLLVAFDGAGSSGKPPAPLPAGVAFWRLAANAGGVTGTAYSPVWELIVGHRSSASVDTSWGATLDVNGDGFADLVVGASASQETSVTPAPAGAAYIYLGSKTGLAAATPPTRTDGKSGNGFGSSVVSVGDVNGDGFADVAISAQDSQSTGLTGTVYIYLGGASGLAATPATTLTMPGATFGLDVTGAGDLNGDGYADLVVSAITSTPAADTAQIFYGSATGIPSTPSRSLAIEPPATGSSGCTTAGGAGRGIASADFNGDGFGDLAISDNAYACAGSVALYLGGPMGLSMNPSATLTDADASDAFGGSLAFADIDGDGYPELLASAYEIQSSSIQDTKIFIYEGGASGLFAGTPAVRHHPGTGETFATLGDPGGQFGGSLASAGDVNGDGFEDIIVSDSTASYYGQTYLYFGAAAGFPATPSQTLAPPNGNDLYWGNVVAGLGDVDGDGYADVAAATTNFADSASTQAVCVFSGGGSGAVTPAMASLTDMPLGADFGASVAGRN